MEQTSIITNPQYLLYEPMVRELGLEIVEIHERIRGKDVELEIAIARPGSDVTTDDCADVYHLVYPVAQTEAGPLRDVFLTVETPGLTRTIKDVHEFALFTGRSVKVYDTGREAWISGTVTAFDGEKLTLSHVKDVEGDLVIGIAQIQKAKLEYLEEDWKDGR